MILIIFILGLIIGSFLNVCIYRIPREESLAYPPSHCTKCGNKIKSYDLIPLISYILLKGKCRYCKEKVSIRYPIIELITGINFSVIYLIYGLGFNFVKYCTFICFLLVIGIIDFDTTDVYVKTTLSGTLAAVIFMIIEKYLYKVSISNYLYGAAMAAGLITLIILFTNGMGWGDVEICGMCGLFLGIKLTIVMLMLSFIIGSIISVLLIALKKKTRKDYIPFGPFISIASALAIFLGDKMIEIYILYIINY
ncbi:prepilin peptidase [Clostridium cochlearium]|uniref:prepilin peptidase n=1 Tax=Clostridium cochlearium TaxID=1494 RepID=UPI001459B64C|nr:A24 family peptidase [Clostridium cochlearium]NME95756.1 prepilin peptidase [Clostridium cochlearium]